MVSTQTRTKSDIFGWPIIGLIFKNRAALFTVRTITMLLFVSALYFGFAYPELSQNPYTTAIFWSLFWPFFMMLSIVLLGPGFCGVCPHGVMGRWISKFGRQKEVPAWLKHRGIGLAVLVTLYWLPVYLLPGVLKIPLVASSLFLLLSVVAAASFYLFKEMAYCTYLCPIGSVTKSYGKMGPVKLQTYQSTCQECTTFDCAKACSSNLQPYLFEKKNSMRDCTLCMDCAQSCEAVSFSLVKPMSGLTGEIKERHNMHVWVFLSLLALITLSMGFHHGLGHSPIKSELPWYMLGKWMEEKLLLPIDWVGFNAVWMAVASVLLFVLGGFKITSMIIKRPYGEVVKELAYALAPLVVFGSLSHAGTFFFLHYASDLVNSYSWLIGEEYIHKPLATFKDKWVHLFGLLGYVGAVATAVLLYIRLGRYTLRFDKKILAWASAASIVWFYLLLQWLQAVARS
ncbi:MAG: 4Fe-4S binding protein [Thiovulaceae bacterium]|nr:4Fe-4S binding protein [Sulfurimonadaceae bacterium]